MIGEQGERSGVHQRGLVKRVKPVEDGLVKSQALFFTGPGQVELQAIELPDEGAGRIWVRTLFSGVSPGTELRCLAGQQPGTLPWPFIPGYSSVGEVVVDRSGRGLAVGTKVFCAGGSAEAGLPVQWGGHAGMHVKWPDEVFPLDAGTVPEEAALAKLAAIAHHGFRRAGWERGERVVVVGLGPIGLLSALLFQQAGAEVLGVDLNERRVEVARAMGLEVRRVEGALGEVVRSVFPGGVEIAVDSTGVAGLLEETMSLLREPPWGGGRHREGRLVIQGSYAGKFSLPYQEAFVRELAVLVPRDHDEEDMRAVLAMLGAGRLRWRGLFGEVRPVAEAAVVYEELRRGDGRWGTAVFAWPGIGV